MVPYVVVLPCCQTYMLRLNFSFVFIGMVRNKGTHYTMVPKHVAFAWCRPRRNPLVKRLSYKEYHVPISVSCRLSHSVPNNSPQVLEATGLLQHDNIYHGRLGQDM
jgi:hypothetical protein